MRHFACSVSIFALSAIFPAAGLAQTQPQPLEQQETADQAGQECRQQLDAFGQRMNEDRFWVTGWGTSWGYGTAGQVTGTASGATNAPGATGAPMGADPWAAAGGAQFGVNSPRNQIEVLYGAAHVLAAQGKQDGCEYVLSELASTYDEYTARLQEAGVDPSEVTNWRQEQIVAARPIEELQSASRFTIDDVTGTDVRNLQDEHLGSVNDVVFDFATGDVSYAIVARGGFLGIGRDYVAVPWDRFLATPGLNTLVLDIPEQAIENAPTIDPDTFADPATVTQQNEQVDQYWEQQAAR